MSLNPARSFGSAVVSGDLAHLWLYFTAPVLGMLAPSKCNSGWACIRSAASWSTPVTPTVPFPATA